MEEKLSGKNIHEPVLVDEIVEALKLDQLAHLNTQAKFIDATIGTAGHGLEIIKRGFRLLGIDLDARMLEIARIRLDACPVSNPKIGDLYTLIQANFKDIDLIAEENGYTDADGIIFDLGVSNLHLTSLPIGISFSNSEAPLDMRLNSKTQAIAAKDLLNVLNIGQLTELFSQTIEPYLARRLAKKIIDYRSNQLFEKVEDLLAVCAILPKRGKLNQATRAFLALRIAVNSELDNISEALPKAFKLLKKGGRLAVISFHSGEDRLVKDYFKDLPESMTIGSLPIVPSSEEIANNPRARSAKMRVVEKI